MTPLHWWALGGTALGIALPLAIHMLTRPRGERRALPTFRFLAASANLSARRSRLRAILILSTRTLALVLLTLAFARFAQWAMQAGAAGAALKRKVVVLDCSLSMRAVEGQMALFDKARVLAQQILSEGDTQAADVILAAREARSIFGQTSSNLAALKDEIAQARALSEPLDPVQALEAAARSFAGVAADELKNCELVIVTDMQRSNWSRANFGRLPRAVPVLIAKVRGSEPLDNLAIVKAGIDGLAEAGAAISAFAEVSNFGIHAADFELVLQFDGRSWSQRGALPGGARKRLQFEINGVPAGWRSGQFTLTPAPAYHDALADDNIYPLSVRVREARHIALITTEAARETGGPAYFLERGLSASPEATAQVQRFTPGQLEGEVDEALAKSDLLAVVNAGMLSDGQVRTLTRLLTSGTAVLYVAQDAVDADNLKALQSALGASARWPVQFAPYKGGAKASLLTSLLGTGDSDRDDAAGRFLTWVDTERRPFRIFGDAVTRFTQSLHLTGGLSTVPRDDAGLETQSILAKYSDGSAALLVTRAASGKLAILNAAVGGSERHIGKHAIFVPLIQELSQELLENSGDAAAPQRLSGVSTIVEFDPGSRKNAADGSVARGAEAFTLRRAGGSTIATKGPDAPRFDIDSAGARLYWRRPADPGAYLIENQGGVRAAFTITAPVEEESDLAVLSDEVFKTRLAQERTLTVVSPSGNEALDAKAETWPWFAAGALACLFLELALLKVFAV